MTSPFGFLEQSCIQQDCCKIVAGLLQDFSNNLAFHKVSKAAGLIDSCRCVNLLFLASKLLEVKAAKGLCLNTYKIVTRLLQDC